MPACLAILVVFSRCAVGLLHFANGLVRLNAIGILIRFVQEKVMAATKFLDDLLDGFVCVADLITSVSYSDEDSILTLQDAARVVLACLRSVKKAPQQMRLDKAGLPVIDLDGGATIFLRKVAENKRYSSLQVSDVVLDEALTSEGADLLEYGFSRDIWDVLREDGIQTSWRLNYKTGLREYSFLSSVWKATPREISVLLEGQGYKRPTVVSLIRKGYAVPAISLSGVAERTAELEIDQEVDLGDVRRWLSKNGINWPIPVMVECEPSEYSYELQTRSSNDTSMAFTVRLQELERQNTDLLQQNADLKAQLLNVKSSSVDQGASPKGLNFPYATKELEAMRQIA